LVHGFPPGFVNSCETVSLLGHLNQDVRGAEYGLQVEPSGLHLQPFIQDLLEEQQCVLPFPTGEDEYNKYQSTGKKTKSFSTFCGRARRPEWKSNNNRNTKGKEVYESGMFLYIILHLMPDILSVLSSLSGELPTVNYQLHGFCNWFERKPAQIIMFTLLTLLSPRSSFDFTSHGVIGPYEMRCEVKGQRCLCVQIVKHSETYL